MTSNDNRRPTHGTPTKEPTEESAADGAQLARPPSDLDGNEASAGDQSTSSSKREDRSRPRLLPQHTRLIRVSAISDQVVVERAYRSVTSKAELKTLGFKDYQCRVPALLLPVHGVHGGIVNYQLRPDLPRINKAGKALKYETVADSKIAIDVPPRVRALLGDPKRDLYITEGIRKADAAISKGLCCIALLGVWNWRGTNEWGGKTVLSDWESIALNGRTVFVVFDSDVMEKGQVELALARLKAWLESKSAHVKVVYLPSGHGGAKVGLDDFFAAGGTPEQLLGLAEPQLRPSHARDAEPEGSYFVRDRSTYWRKPVGDGFVETKLANFEADIESERKLDDGVETTIEFRLRVRFGDKEVSGGVPARDFSSMNWVTELCGAGAIVEPGFGIRDRLRAAIQDRSADQLRSEAVHTHSGWIPIGGGAWAYLHAGGPIGPKGPTLQIGVELPAPLHALCLPQPPEGDELRACIESVLELLAELPSRIGAVLVALVFRAVLGGTDFSLFLVGETGAFKTELAALAQAFFGAGFNARNLPTSWSATANFNEQLAFLAKDALLVIDDYKPVGSRADIQRSHRDADRILRAQGNHSGRGRLTADASARPVKPPRGTILATGEDLPPGSSLLARTLVVEVAKGDVSSSVLSKCQKHAADGRYAGAAAAFVQHVAGHYDEIQQRLRARAIHLRDAARSERPHLRTASIVGELQAGFEMFLEFAAAGSPRVDTAERERLGNGCWNVLLELANEQAREQATFEPAGTFLRLVSSALVSGRAHFVAPDGREPPNCERFGWSQVAHAVGGEAQSPRYRANGSCVGWVDGEDLYLDGQAALKAAQEMADDTSRLTITLQRLNKHLQQRGYLASTEPDHLAVRRELQGVRRRVLHLTVGVLTEAVQSVHSVHSPTRDPESGDSEADSRTAAPTQAGKVGPQSRSTAAPDEEEPRSAGAPGPHEPGRQPIPQASAAEPEVAARGDRLFDEPSIASWEDPG